MAKVYKSSLTKNIDKMSKFIPEMLAENKMEELRNLQKQAELVKR
jgi:hypothetical protein